MKFRNTLLSTISLLLPLINSVKAEFEEETKAGMYEVHPHSLTTPFVEKLDMPWFEFGGDTVIDTYTHIRLTPDSSSRSGYIWSKLAMPDKNWQVEFDFKIHGSSSYISGDGLAFWVVKDKNKQGPVFGNADYFDGLGVFFDTYANEAHDESFPYVSAMLGDGKTTYNVNNDGYTTKLGGCSADIKHAEFPTRALVTYVKDQFLEIKLKTTEEGDYEHCFTVDNIKLPKDVYMGFTALTGQLHDNHDILKVTTRTSATAPTYKPLRSKATVKKYGGGGFWTGLGWIFKLSLVGAFVAVCYYGYKNYQAKANKRF